MILSAAYFLVFHGSRDNRTQAAAFDLKQLLTEKCQSINMLAQRNHLRANPDDFELELAAKPNLDSPLLIEMAALEITTVPLRERLVDFAHKAIRHGVEEVRIIPLFLTPGVHVQQDIPAEIAAATNQINRQVTLKLSPYLGKYSGMVSLLARQFAKLPAKERILIAHGTRLPLSVSYYQNMAQELHAELAYWSTPPQVIDKIKMHIALGHQKIALLPYFLFPGKITAAIAQEVNHLQQQYPQVALFLGQPLGASAALAELIAKEIQAK